MFQNDKKEDKILI